jgi:3-hydroxy-9,10-secoandrosta-1,3,5(10)-triene-9,17-dione monooxygenase reductase component
VLICIERAASVYPTFRAASAFAVNILSARQEPLARRFAATGEDRFDGVGFTRGSTGTALLDDTLAYLECHARGAIDGGDHTIFLGEVESGVIREGPDVPLLYYRGGYAQLDR